MLRLMKIKKPNEPPLQSVHVQVRLFAGFISASESLVPCLSLGAIRDVFSFCCFQCMRNSRGYVLRLNNQDQICLKNSRPLPQISHTAIHGSFLKSPCLGIQRDQKTNTKYQTLFYVCFSVCMLSGLLRGGTGGMSCASSSRDRLV